MARILIADDDTDIRELVEFKLSSQGHEIIATTNGAEAWEWLENNERPDLALLDVMMPGLSGVEVLHHVRADARLEDLKVILLTGRDTVEVAAAGPDRGADAVMAKPFSPRDLAERIANILQD